MRQIQLFFVAFLFVIPFTFGIYANDYVFADDHDEEKYYHHSDDNDEESVFEEIGEVAGWGAVILIGASGVLYPLRRSTKIVLSKIPSAKIHLIAFSKFLGKRHIFIGISALIISIAHGVSMFIDEGELELEAFTGIGSILLMMGAAIAGGILFKNKKAKNVRTIHILLIFLASIIGVFHIFIA